MGWLIKPLKMNAVQQYFGEQNTRIGFVSGLVGGFAKFISTVEISSLNRLAEAAITALVCGAAGVVGKEIVVAIKKKINRSCGRK
jgi:hypothetical protein